MAYRGASAEDGTTRIWVPTSTGTGSGTITAPLLLTQPTTTLANDARLTALDWSVRSAARASGVVPHACGCMTRRRREPAAPLHLRLPQASGALLATGAKSGTLSIWTYPDGSCGVEDLSTLHACVLHAFLLLTVSLARTRIGSVSFF
jgi:hypothetical protein